VNEESPTLSSAVTLTCLHQYVKNLASRKNNSELQNAHSLSHVCFKCPSCAKAYISSTWFRRHLGRCPQPTGASTGL